MNLKYAIAAVGLVLLLAPHSVHQILFPGPIAQLPHPIHMASGIALLVMATKI